MASNLTVVATQLGIKHFKNMSRFRFTLDGGSNNETISIPNMDLSVTDYIRVIPDPASQVMTAAIIESLASRTQTAVVLTSADSSTLPAGLACELVVIKRQMGDGSATLRLVGNTEDTLFGPRDEAGSSTFLPNSGGTDVVACSQVTEDSIILLDQTVGVNGLPGGICEDYAARVSGTSFTVYQASGADTPSGPSEVGYTWMVLQP